MQTLPTHLPFRPDHEILRSHRTPADRGTRAGNVLLLQRPHDLFPFVTCWLGDGDTSWCHGHYLTTREEADKDFEERAKRGF